MTNEEQVQRYRESGDPADLAALWEQVRRFARQQAERFFAGNCERCQSHGVAVDDLTQCAFEALRVSVGGFDESRGQFLTYYGKALVRRFGALCGEGKALRPLDIAASLSEPITGTDGEEGSTLEDLIADTMADVEGTVIDREYTAQLRRDLFAVMDAVLTDSERALVERYYFREESRQMTAEERHKTRNAVARLSRSKEAKSRLYRYREGRTHTERRADERSTRSQNEDSSPPIAVFVDGEKISLQ